MTNAYATLITYMEPGGEKKQIIIKTSSPVTKEHAENFMKRLAEQGRPYEHLLNMSDVSDEYKSE